jgi:hypothetical protein
MGLAITVREMARAGRFAVCLVFTAALLAGCAKAPLVSAAPIESRLLEQSTSFALADAVDDASRMAAPFVERRLREFGFEPSANPDLLVEIASSDRSRAVGAYLPDTCEPPDFDWVEPRGDAWLIGGSRVLSLKVRLIDKKTGAPVYQATAQRRMSGGFTAARVEKLVNTALMHNPREATVTTGPDC